MDIFEVIIIRNSYTDLFIILFEVEFLSLWSHKTWSFGVYRLYIILEFSFSLCGGQVVWEFSSVLNLSNFFFTVPALVVFVEEVSVIGLWSHDTIVQQKL